jgi:hypothetical protein
MTAATTVDDVMYNEKRDMLFIHFEPKGTGQKPAEDILKLHFDWFNEQGLEYKSAEFVEVPGTGEYCYAVYFAGTEDPRVKLYSDKFEDENFVSLQPNRYQMYMVNYVFWYSNGGKERMEAKLKL